MSIFHLYLQNIQLILLFSIRSVPDKYVNKLIENNVLLTNKVKNIIGNYNSQLNQSLNEMDNFIPQPTYFAGLWTGIKQAEASVTEWNTGVDLNLLKFVAEKSVHIKDDLVRICHYESLNKY